MDSSGGFAVKLLNEAKEKGYCIGVPHKSDEGGKRQVCCQLCNKAMFYKSFYAHVNRKHDGRTPYAGESALFRRRLYFTDHERRELDRERSIARKRLKRAAAASEKKVCEMPPTD